MQLYALFLFEESLNTAKPWAEAGYICYCVDLSHPAGETREGNYVLVGADIYTWELPAGIVFAFACGMPDCTHLAASGARWWESKGLETLAKALLLVGRTETLLKATGAGYYIENPIGRLATCWRQPDYRFDPCDFAGYLPATEMQEDAYTKQTCLWTGGGFVMPERRPVFPIHGSKMHLISPSPKNDPGRRARLRSETPRGFALAVMLANSQLVTA